MQTPASVSVFPAAPAVDIGAARSAVHALLVALGVDLAAPDLRDTPLRVAAALAEALTAERFAFTTFPNHGRYDEFVVVRDVPFHSLCRHHLLPFAGVAHVGYLPDERIVGLSKLARAVDFHARRLQVQEELTVQIADFLGERLEPRGVGVVLEATHSCMTLRGVAKTGSRTVTSALRGLIRDDGRTRQEFLALVGGPPAGH